MLLRDLDWKPREKKRFFEVATLRMADGRTMYFMRAANRQPGYIAMTITSLDPTVSNYWSRDYTECREFEDDEFTAQAVLDHYVQTIGLKN